MTAGKVANRVPPPPKHAGQHVLLGPSKIHGTVAEAVCPLRLTCADLSPIFGISLCPLPLPPKCRLVHTANTKVDQQQTYLLWAMRQHHLLHLTKAVLQNTNESRASQRPRTHVGGKRLRPLGRTPTVSNSKYTSLEPSSVCRTRRITETVPTAQRTLNDQTPSARGHSVGSTRSTKPPWDCARSVQTAQTAEGR